MLKISSSTLRTAAGIQEEIEKLEGELEQLLTASGVSKAGDGSLGSHSQRGTTKVVARSATKKAGKSGPGALAAGVRQILRRQGKPIEELPRFTAGSWRLVIHFVLLTRRIA